MVNERCHIWSYSKKKSYSIGWKMAEDLMCQDTLDIVYVAEELQTR